MITSKPTRKPTGHITPFGLRLQPQLKAQAEGSAARAGRSLNAEIVHVLESYYAQKAIHDGIVDAALAEGSNAEPAAIFDTWRKFDLPELRLTLDAGEQPICWDEIHEYMRAIRKAMNINDVQLSVTVKAGEHVSSNDREAETQALARKLRKKPAP